MRGQGPDDFAPDIAYLKFDADGDVDWFFGTTTAGLTWDRVDFVTVVRHEFLHSLGFIPQPTFNRFVSGGTFTGPNARAANRGLAVPLQGVHIDPSIPSVMNSVTLAGERSDLGPLEWGVLQDLGWSVSAGVPAPDLYRGADLFTGGQGDGTATLEVVPSRGVHLMRLDVLAGDTVRLRTYDGAGASQRGLDSFLRLFDEQGREVLRSNDTSPAAGKEDFTYTFPAGGRYWVGAGAYAQRDYTTTAGSNAPAPSGSFLLDVTLTGRVDSEPHSIAQATTGVPFEAGRFAVETTLAGAAADVFRIDARAGGVYTITTAPPASGGLAGPSVLGLYDESGRKVAGMDGASPYGRIAFTAPASAAYYVRVARAAGPNLVAADESPAPTSFQRVGAGGVEIEGDRGFGNDYALTIEEFVPPPPASRDPLFLDFGSFGLWRWTESGGLRQINEADPQDFAAAPDGSLFVDYGRFGIWRWTEAGGMSQVNAADPQGMAVGPDGALYLDYGSFGLWRWGAADGARQVNAADPQAFIAGAAGELFVDFGGFGLWRWNAGAGLRRLSEADPQALAYGGPGTLFVDYGRFGLWLWSEAGGLFRMNAADPGSFAAGPDGSLFVDFDAGGLWMWRQGLFTSLNPADAQALAVAPDGWLYIDFGASGVWRWAPVAGFRRLNAADAQRIAVAPAFSRG